MQGKDFIKEEVHGDMVELGQIQKPQADSFSGKRKIYCVANLHAFEDAPDEFRKLVDKYWDEVAAQIDKVEAAGKITKIFCELIHEEGDDALDFLSKIQTRIPDIIRKKKEEDVPLFPLEKKEIFGPYIDWGNCLRVVFTREVFTKVLEYYQEAADRRLGDILRKIEENLGESEAALLIMKDEDRAKLQFPKDIEIFLITPPSYDDIMRWMRDRIEKKAQKDEDTEPAGGA
jgi:hypothetical protein